VKIVQESKGQLQVVYPPVSIRAEPHVAIVDANVDRKRTRAAAVAYMTFLYTDEAQEIIARHYYRPANDEVLKRLMRTMAEEVGAEAFLRQQQAIMARPDSRPGLSAITCPTLVLVGDGDAATPPALSQEIAAAIPGARLVVVPDCGHMSTLERPQAVAEALVDWMRS
jgi:pimeloyl-ACP methyl ester carboxylesterase